jgi:hypothetical protein
MGRLQNGVYSTWENAHVWKSITVREKNSLKEEIYL